MNGRWTTWAACALVVTGACLRLHHLDAMEFKRDEQDVLSLGIRLLTDHSWSSPRSWPTHGMLSSNGVPNPPLFTWIVAAAWALTRHPVGVARVIAMTNAICLYPLWLWARRHMDERRALLTLAISAVSPFAVMFSRKIWTQDLLFPGVLALLWGVEWLRGERPWRGMALLVVSVLLVGQLHQSGAIGMMLLPVAIGVQVLFDRRHGARFHLGRPSIGEAVALAIALGLNVIFWVPYLTYLAQLPAGLLANRPTLEVVVPDLLLRTEAQIVPLDLLYFFDPHRNDFLRSPIRFVCFYGSVALGAPLLVYGLWRWLRSMVSVPVFGIWWWCVIAAFALARIPCHPFYVLALAPITALLAAGAFDEPSLRAGVARALMTGRLSYVAALLALTIVTQAWLTNRGGAAGDYGITYLDREAQARSIVSRLESQPPPISHALGELRPDEEVATLACGPVPVEVSWIVRWLDQKQTEVPQTFRICDAWIDQGDGLVYRWSVRD